MTPEPQPQPQPQLQPQQQQPQQQQRQMGGGGLRTVQIQRSSNGLGIILQTTNQGHPLVEKVQGAAAQAGVQAGSVIVACCGVQVQGRGDRAVVEVIKGLPATAP